jgi:hypothetical protein
MTYPFSPGVQSLPVPGIGFCQSIFVDRDAVDRLHHPVWPFSQAWDPISTDRKSREAAGVAAVGYRVQ